MSHAISITRNRRAIAIVGALGIVALATVVAIALALAAGRARAQSSQEKLSSAPAVAATAPWSPTQVGEPIAADPIWVYNDWSAYDELSDNIPLTEDLVMREMNEIARLQKLGVHFDYFMQDAFWFDADGAYRKFRSPNWPNGPDRWLAACKAHGLKPGLWFSTNTLVKINAAPQWRDSLNSSGGSMSFYEGGFLPDLMAALQFWYDRGVRMFEFDFADFDAATPNAQKTEKPAEIRAHNVAAFREALMKFRAKNPDIVLVAFNGFGGDVESTAGAFPFHNSIDLGWLAVFDSLYSGDPRPGDVPEMSFWRSMDIYSDHMVRRYEQSFLPLERIDSTSFMIGNTGTIYYRKTHAWKGMFLLMVARGGWVNTIHGNLEFLDDEKARWLVRVQKIYENFKARGRTKTFGGIPGNNEPYGFGSLDSDGAIYSVVNPAQEVRELEMPRLSQAQPALAAGRVIFRDAGFVPQLHGDRIMLGPGQLAAVAYGRYASPAFDLGVQDDVRIPLAIATIPASFTAKEQNTIEATLPAAPSGDLRIVFQQRDSSGNIMRSWPGGPPNGTSVAKVLKISVEQDGKPLHADIDYDRLVWSGLSWGAGEVKHDEFAAEKPVVIRCSSTEKNAVELEGHLYNVRY
jgi:hypothetical protein